MLNKIYPIIYEIHCCSRSLDNKSFTVEKKTRAPNLFIFPQINIHRPDLLIDYILGYVYFSRSIYSHISDINSQSKE